MPTGKPFTTIVFDDEMLKRIDDFRFNNRFSSRSKAVMFIIKAGMKALSDDYPELDMNAQLETGRLKKNVLLVEDEQSSI